MMCTVIIHHTVKPRYPYEKIKTEIYECVVMRLGYYCEWTDLFRDPLLGKAGLKYIYICMVSRILLDEILIFNDFS